MNENSELKEAIEYLEAESGGFIATKHKLITGILTIDDDIVGFLVDFPSPEEGEALEHPVYDAEYAVLEVDQIFEQGEEVVDIDLYDIIEAYGLNDKYNFIANLSILVEERVLEIDNEICIVSILQYFEEEQ